MRFLSGEPADTAVLAFVTTLHCALIFLRRYRPRAGGAIVMLPSVVFVVLPWYLSTPMWLAVGFASHIVWFIACERLLPPQKTSAPAAIAKTQPRAPAAAAQPAKGPTGFVSVPVLATVAETEEIRTFRMKRPPGFTFQPGQFAMVKVQIDAKPIVRCYSIVSAPAETGFIEIAVRNQGLVSNHLHSTLRPGVTIDVRGPGGAFVLPAGGRPVVLIAGGIGITPLLCMLRHSLATDPSRQVTLLLSAKTAAHVPFLDELRLQDRRHPSFRFVIALSRGSDDPAFYSGRIDKRLIETVVEHVRDSVYMMCGPLAMIDDTKQLLESMGVPSGQIHFEKFETAVSSAAAAGSASAQPKITLKRSGHIVKVSAGQTILDAAEGAGASLPSMCRVGVCGTCRTRLLSGEVEGDFDALDAADQAEGCILPCVARPVSDCAIDA